MAEGRFDLVIGTQLVAKGHHFPRLNLVGIVDADLGLGNGDPRAGERTFQLLHQVVGRAGREEGRGVGYLQTHQPEHPVMKALISGDREAFYSSEIELRERTGYPPFGRLASLVISANERHAAESYGRSLASHAPKDETVRVLGPAEAPIAVVRGRHRFRAAGEGAAQLRSVGLFARMAGQGAQAARQCAVGGRRRSAELCSTVPRMSATIRSSRCTLPHTLLTPASRSCFTFGCSSTLAAAAKISAKPMMSDVVGRSPTSHAEPITPTTGTSSEPSEAVDAGSRTMTTNQRK